MNPEDRMMAYFSIGGIGMEVPGFKVFYRA